MRSIVVVVDEAPHKNLLANQRNKLHWTKTSPCTVELRKAAKYCAVDQKPDGWEDPIGWYRATVTVGWPDDRYPVPKPGKPDQMPDLDTALVACKPALDGLEDAGIIASDAMAVEYVVRQVRTDDPRGWIAYEIEEVDDPGDRYATERG